MSEAIDAQYDEYRFAVACKECGVVDEVTLTHEQASGVSPIEDDPARRHYERTDHTAARLNYTTAPPDVREMLDGGEADDLDWSRIMEWLDSQSDGGETAEQSTTDTDRSGGGQL